LGLRKLRGSDFFSLGAGAAAMIGLYSPLLAQKQPDHPANLQIAGFAFHDRHMGDGDEVSPALGAFLAAGPPPIVFTLGSFFARDQIAIYRAGVEAARRLKRRAVLLVNQDDLEEARALAAEDAFVAAYVPHSRVFPRAAAIVHHGGIGTTGQALRAGAPQLVTPLMGDQTDNGARLGRLGVARMLKPEWATVDSLTRELSCLLGDEAYARKTREIAPLIAKEDGARVAAESIAGLITV
ncbi:MAG: glycosyltransferase, partial [Methylocystis sp.]|nr:glycosyltransferase [Methylocystis sp.]